MTVLPNPWAIPCRLHATTMIEEETVEAARSALAYAKDRLARHPGDIASYLSLRLDMRRTIKIWHHGDCTRLSIQPIDQPVVWILLGPHTRSSSRIRPADRFAETHLSAALGAIAAADVHLGGIPDRLVSREETDLDLERLRSIEAHVRNSRPASKSGRSDRLHGWVDAPTPWSPLSAPSVDPYGQRGAERLTPSERRRWDMVPSARLQTGLEGEDKTPFVMISSLRAGRPKAVDPIEDLRRIRSLARI